MFCLTTCQACRCCLCVRTESGGGDKQHSSQMHKRNHNSAFSDSSTAAKIFYPNWKCPEQCFEWKQTSKRKTKHENRKKYTYGERGKERARGANDIIFILVNEFWTRKKNLTSPGLYFCALSRCRQSNFLFTSDEGSGGRIRRRRRRSEWKSNKKQFRLILFLFFSFSPKWKLTDDLSLYY